MLAETRTAPERTPGVQTAHLVKSPDAPWNRGLIKRKFQKVTRAGGGLGVTTEEQHEGPVWHQDALSRLRAGDPRPPVGGAAGSRTHTDWVRARGWGPGPCPGGPPLPGPLGITTCTRHGFPALKGPNGQREEVGGLPVQVSLIGTGRGRKETIHGHGPTPRSSIPGTVSLFLEKRPHL